MTLKESNARADEIIHLVCKVCQISEEQLLGRDGHYEYAVPRALSIYMLFTYTIMTFSEIGKRYSNRTHPSITSMIDTGRQYVMQQPHITHIYQRIVDKLNLGDFKGYSFIEERQVAREIAVRKEKENYDSNTQRQDNSAL